MGVRPFPAIVIFALLFLLAAAPARAESWNAELNRSRILLRQGRLEAAEAAAQTALQKARGAYGPASRQAARALGQLGSIHGWRHDHDAAETVKTEALRIMERHHGPSHPILPPYLDSLALTLSRQQRYDAAETPYLRALAIREAALGPEHPEVADTLARLAENYRRQQKYAEAESLGLRALTIRRKRLGPDHEAVGESLFFMAALFEMQRKFDEAEPWYRQALELNDRRWGKDSPRAASMARRLADVLREMEQFEEAETLYRRAMAIWRERMGAEDRQTQTVQKRLESLAARREGAPRRERSGGFGPSERLGRSDWKRRMARVETLRKAGEIAGALGVAEAAARDAETAVGRNHPWVAEALTRAAGFRKILGDVSGAEAAYRRSLHILETAHGARSVEASLALDHLAEVYREREKFPQAIALGDRALGIWAEQFGADHPTVRVRRERLEALRTEARRAAPRVSGAGSTSGDPNVARETTSGRPPDRPEVWRTLRENVAGAWDAAAAKWKRFRNRIDFSGPRDAWDAHAGFLLKKFSWQ